MSDQTEARRRIIETANFIIEQLAEEGIEVMARSEARKILIGAFQDSELSKSATMLRAFTEDEQEVLLLECQISVVINRLSRSCLEKGFKFFSEIENGHYVTFLRSLYEAIREGVSDCLKSEMVEEVKGKEGELVVAERGGCLCYYLDPEKNSTMDAAPTPEQFVEAFKRLFGGDVDVSIVTSNEPGRKLSNLTCSDDGKVVFLEPPSKAIN